MLTLTTEQIKEITGYSWKQKQIQELVKRGVPFAVNGRGALIVLKSDLLNRGGENRDEPDYEAI